MTTLMLSFLMLAGQPETDWTRVAALVPGTEIRIQLAAGGLDGRFLSATADALTFRANQREVTLRRLGIKRIDTKLPGGTRARNLRMGFVAGLGAGALRAALCGNCGALGRVMVVGPFAVVGTVAGGTASAVKWETVYRRQK